MTLCDITGEAIVLSTSGGPEWVRTDPEIHVDVELIESPLFERSIFEERYQLGDVCPANPHVRHATRITERTDR